MNSAPTVNPSFVVQVDRLLQEGEPQVALDLAAQGVRGFPTYYGGYIMLSRCYLQLGHADAAMVILDEVERRFPGRLTTNNLRNDVGIASAQLQAVHDALNEEVLNDTAALLPAIPEEQEPVDEAEDVESLDEDHSLTDDRQQWTEDVLPLPDAVPSPAKIQQHVEGQQTEADLARPAAAVSVLRMIDLAPASTDTRIIRSTSMRLIPGLEFTSLRFEGAKHRGRRNIQSLPEPPAFREFHAARPSVAPPRPTSKPSLESLAERINRARITAEDLVNRPHLPAPAPAPSPSHQLHTETLTRIYMQQERWNEAIEGWEALMQKNPQHKKRYMEYIEECRSRRESS